MRAYSGDFNNWITSLSTMLSQVSSLRFGSITAIKGGAKKVLTFDDEQNLFEVLTNAGCIPKDRTCMGNMACGKCKVKVVSGKVPKMEEEENDLLEDAPKGTRLACAVSLTAESDGAVF